MMGGLAYMTGRPGDPLRAGTSVNDIMGGLFGAIGALGALIQRGITGQGMEVQSALFENNVFLMGQHMLQYAMTGKHPAPMPARDNPWAIYDVFTVQGRRADLPRRRQRCAVADVLRRARLRRPQGRRRRSRPTTSASARARRCSRCCASGSPTRTADDLAALFERAGLPFAPIRRPEDLYDDPHSLATGGLADVRLPDGDKAGQTVKTTLFPITMAGARLGVRLRSAAAGRAHARAAGHDRLWPRRDRRAARAIGGRVIVAHSRIAGRRRSPAELRK